jgi:hypothetical protein
MYQTTLYKIIDKFINKLTINGFKQISYGDEKDLDFERQNNYPLAHLVLPSGKNDEKVTTISFVLIVADKALETGPEYIQYGKDNTIDIQQDLLVRAQTSIKMLDKRYATSYDSIEIGYDLNYDMSFNSFKENLPNLVTGFIFSIEISFPNMYADLICIDEENIEGIPSRPLYFGTFGTAKPWDDLRIEPIARTTGTNAPTFEQYYNSGVTRGVYLYSFDDSSSEKEVFFTMQLPHSWDGGSIYMHVHWVGAVADTTAAPRWGLEYVWKDLGEVFGETIIIYSDGLNYVTGGTEANIVANKHYISKFPEMTTGTTSNDISSIIIGRLFRNSAHPADTYNASGAKCGLLYIDAHYQIARLGSTDEYVA